MKTDFYKFQGTGNDFIVIDNRKLSFKANPTLISSLCNPKYGIGADGLILLQEAENADFRMVYYNSDGNESTMCGNGGRCIVFFAAMLNIIKDEANFLAIDGIHKAFIKHREEKSALVSLKMNDVSHVQNLQNDFALNTGSPHYVRFVESADAINVNWEGEVVRNSDPFREEGINVNFVEKKSNRIYVRTFERGVEAETLSCGTGVVAAAIAAHYSGIVETQQMLVKTLGGDLSVAFKAEENGNYSDIWLTGPAAMVFKGEIEI